MRREVSPFVEVSLWLNRQLGRTFFGAKGVAVVGMAILSVVGMVLLATSFDKVPGSLTMQISGSIEPSDGAADVGKEIYSQMKVAALGRFFGEGAAVDTLAKVPDLLLVTFKLGSWFSPAIVLLLGYDLLGGEGAVRTLRYFTGRSRRWTMLLGKSLGLMVAMAAITLLIEFIIAAVLVVRGRSHFAETLEWGLVLWTMGLPALMGWCAITSLVASAFLEPMVALLATSGLFFVLWLLQFSAFGSYLYPATYTDPLFTLKATTMLPGLLGELILVAGSLGLGAYAFEKAEV